MLTDEILTNWSVAILNHAAPIASLDTSSYPAWTIKLSEGYGVAIPYSGDEVINEKFSGAKIYSSNVSFANTSKKALLLTSNVVAAKNIFAALCAEFVSPGINGEDRNRLVSSPITWWKDWKQLLGNKDIDSRVYDVLGELCALKKLIDLGESPIWNGPHGASYDIETSLRFVEVKSTIIRDKREITISNHFQLDPPGKKLHLFFCQFEPASQSGISINSVINELKMNGVNIDDINENLASLGFDEGKSDRNKPFILHSMLEYEINDKFPRITPALFIGGVLPAGINKITYTVDLSSMNAKSIL